MTSTMPTRATLGLHRLSGAGVELVLAESADGLPEVLHWGAPLGDPDADELRLAVARQVSPSALDAPWPLTVAPAERDGWEGRPALVVHRGGHALSPRWQRVEVTDAPGRLVITADDAAQGVGLTITLALDEAGVLHASTEVRNLGTAPLEVVALETVLPVGDNATEVLDFSGRWTRERAPQRGPLLGGSRVRESRRGRTGHDSPMLLAVGTAGFDDRQGEIWAAHLAWSGDAVYRTDALPESRPVIGAGPLLRAGEISLEPGTSLTAPETVFVWSDGGLNGVSARLHRSLRARPGHPSTPRPVTLNTWEAVYFDHDLDRLSALAHAAAGLGVERFVLDDGWFRGRRDDAAGLGDWQVDAEVWPHGLGPLADLVHGLGMQFGLWFEPEMANEDSDLVRLHPQWLLQPLADEVRAWRHQYVLDLARDDVFAYLLESISSIVTEYQLDYIKWDQNRDITEAVHADRAGVYRHTEAVYALLDALRERHPSLEIESCASGGARVDYGVLARTDRVWASDTNDPVERLEIQRWTELLLPPELIGAHVGPARAHTTGRETSIDFRIAAALFDSMGIEWDITRCTPDELARLRAGIAAYVRLRPLLHTGVMRQGDGDDPGLVVTSVLAADKSTGVVRIARTRSSERSLPPLLRVPGLDPASVYRIAPVEELTVPDALDTTPPPWLHRGALRLTGAALGHLGVRIPLLAPEQALVLELEREGRPAS